MAPYNEKYAASKITCLSSQDHGCDIKDHLLHYLGCIEICEREDFFSEGHSIWKEEMKHQEKNFPELPAEEKMAKAKRLTDQKRTSWKADCENELKRIAFLRQRLTLDSDDKHLVESLTKSRSAWENSLEYKDNIARVIKWRKARGKGDSVPPDESNIKEEEYDPEKDITVPIIQFEDGQGTEEEDSRVWNKFPNQKTTLNHLLNDKESLLPDKSSSDRLIRYFHMPSNNMDWVERAIGRYFGEERPDYQATRRELRRAKKTKAHMILRDSYWRGQLRGGQPHNPAHARHMKPLCATISSDVNLAEDFPKNMVLFMPYLHWDTSRKIDQFTMEIEDIMGHAKEQALKRKMKEKAAQQENRYPLSRIPPLDPKSISTSSTPPLRNRKYKTKIMTMSRLLKLMREREMIKSQLKVDNNGRVEISNPLGQFLIDAARLYEGMSNYRDKKLLRQYLSADPPLHPRRTLDQAYHWTLNSTRERDRDQVVYRDTTAKTDDFHRYDPETGKWLEHEDFAIQGDCEECRRNIQKLSRVIMVDQLWMWILDAKTIITCFPKRYGANKQDSTAVHKSIRVRIQDLGPDQIRTVFDLGLVIIDECVNVLFDRTKTTDRRPQVIEAFSRAIGNIMNKQTVAFERLWRWTDDASEIYKSNGNPDTSSLHVTLLDINPEGQLEREIKDVVEELDIMIHISHVHKRMLEAFISNAEGILDPLGKFGNSQKREILGGHLRDRSATKSQDFHQHNKEGDERTGRSAEDEAEKKRRDDYNWFKLNADDCLETINRRIEELNELRDIADNTATGVKDLLELKQQQASVVQAWQAVRQSDETIKQGRSIMMFTLVTIVFLPLSFMSSVFGMNNMEITDSTWSIHSEFMYMFSISAAVIFVSLLLAFGSWIRASVFYIWKWFATSVLVWTGLYNLWRDVNWPSKRLHNEANGFADKLKENARRCHLDKRMKRKEQEQKKEQQQGNPDNTDQTSTRNIWTRFSRVNGLAPEQENGYGSSSSGSPPKIQSGPNSRSARWFSAGRHSRESDIEQGPE